MTQWSEPTRDCSLDGFVAGGGGGELMRELTKDRTQIRKAGKIRLLGWSSKEEGDRQ